MSDFDPTRVSEHEHSVTRVFSYDPDGKPGDTFDLIKSLGIKQADAAHIQRVPIKDLGDMPVSRFLSLGHAIEDEALAQFAPDLDALTGTIFVFRSGAFVDRPLTLITGDDVRLVAAFVDPGTDMAFAAPIKTASAEGILTPPPAKKKPSDAAMSGRVATIALLVMALLVWLMIRIAG